MAESLVVSQSPDSSGKADAKKSGTTVDPGPYEAIVVRHVAGSRMGELQVYIPDLGGNKTDTAGFLKVSYASPFYGKTLDTDSGLLPDGANTSGQSYGMWFVPPDIGCKVLVTFVAGDRDRGYWFACCYDSTSHHMVPGLGRNVGGPADTVLAKNSQINQYLSKESNPPVVESNTASPTAFNADGIDKTTRYPHEYQTSLLVLQGLDKDKIRGAISSSSLRESPSNVYGISTPGRRATKSDQVAGSPQKVVMRRGGHQFVMDDGAAGGNEKEGTDQLIRLRTAGGHQILMNDTEQVFYIASAGGYQWLEFSNNGMINMFGYAGFNLRSAGALNFHSDTQVNIHSGGTVAINGVKGVDITSQISCSMSGLASASVKSNGALSLSGMITASLSSGGMMTVGTPGWLKLYGTARMDLNGVGLAIPVPVIPKQPNKLPDVLFGGTTWQLNEEAVESICTVVPCHEPWVAADGTRPAPDAQKGSMLKNLALGVGAVGVGIGISTAVSSIANSIGTASAVAGAIP